MCPRRSPAATTLPGPRLANGAKTPAHGLTTIRSVANKCSPSGPERVSSGGAARASSRASRWPGVLTVSRTALFKVRFTRPVRTLPGPNSTKVVNPASARVRRLCDHRTGLQSWAFIRTRQVAGLVWLLASTLATTTPSGWRTSVRSMASSSRSRAGAIYGVWNAPETSRAVTRLAPRALASSPAAATPSGEPAITTCPGAL